MDQGLALGFNAIPVAIKHGNKVWDPVHHRYRKARGRIPQEDQGIYERGTMEEKGLVLRRRRDVGSDEEIVETVRHRGEVLPRRPRRPGYGPRKASSADNLRGGAVGAAAGAGAGAMIPYRRRDDYSDSEGSVPPRSRVRAKSSSGRARGRRGSSTSSQSTSSLCSSTEDEKNIRKMQRKKWLTAGLATVATVHAASKVYSSIEAHDKRIADVQAGKLSPEEAHKKQRAARWQDAAAIAIAALGIKGSISEWHEVQEEHAQHKELMEKKEEHHKKRLEQERRKRAQSQGGYYKGRDGNWYYDGPVPQSSSSARGDSRRGGGGGGGAGGRYDDQRMIEDSSRQARMADDDRESVRNYRSRSKSRGRRNDSPSAVSMDSAAFKKKHRKFEKPKETMKDFGVDFAEEILEVL